MRVTNIVLNVLSLLLVAAGLALISTFFVPAAFVPVSDSPEAGVAPPEDFNVPVLTEETAPREPADEVEDDEAGGPLPGAGEKKPEKSEPKKRAAPVPEDKTLWVTVPRMSRVQDAPIPYAAGDDEESLKDYAGIHLQGTGFPWQKEANVYIAGHRLGYPNTRSFLAFWDLNSVKNGDEVYVTDAMGRSYTYRVFKRFVVEPSDIFITQPMKGKNIVTLQTCTLPDYSQRLIVQAEKVT
jgi:sortase A